MATRETDSAQRRRDAFEKFHNQLGRPWYSPEFEDSLIAVMADPDTSLEDRVYAWCRWRSWFNSSLTPVSDWENGYALDQQDCALDLAWLADGKTAKWVRGITKELRQCARQKDSPERPLRALSKQRMSQAFAGNLRRGTVRYERSALTVPPSPVPDPAPQSSGALDSRLSDVEFLEWARVHYSTDCEEYLVRRDEYYEARKVLRSRYREYAGSRTQNGSILIEENTHKQEETKHTQAAASESTDSPCVCVPDEVSSDPPEPPADSAVPRNALIKAHNSEESWACFWSVYSGFSDSRQEEAKRWWFRHVRSDEYAAEVMGGLLRWKVSDRWSRGIVQHAINFLQKHEYREKPAPKKATSKREEVKDQLMEWADARDRARAHKNGGGT